MIRPPVRSKCVGKVSELTVATPIRPGCIREEIVSARGVEVFTELRTYRLRLTSVLAGLQSRIESGRPISPSLLGTIHSARWFIVDDDPPREDRAGMLLFTSHFDGDAKLYLRDFSTLIPEDLDLVWGNCVGYPAQGCRDFEAFWKYTQQHQIETLTFVPSHPEHTVKDIELVFGEVARLRKEVTRLHEELEHAYNEKPAQRR